MHINHRRKNIYRAKHHGSRPFPLMLSMRPYRVEASRQRRARDRHLMVHGKYDMLMNKDRRDILWEYW